VALLDRDGVVVSVNRHWRQFGLERGGSATSELGTNYLDICARARDEEPEAARAGVMVEAALRGEWPELRLEYPCGEEPDGGTRWYALQAIPIPGKHSGALVVHIDVTPYVQRERMWQHRATHDDLTGLPNRTLVCDRLTHALHVAERDLSPLAVLFLDLDGFKAVNDQLGHDAGDEILRAVARRLEACVRAADTVGRWAGDEFLVVADRLRDTHEAEELAERIRWSLARPIDVPGAAPSAVTVSASIGIAHRDARHRSAGALVHAADMALVEGRLAAGRAGRR
jgi:diguanylate cyclase (GGDEF)-like protein